MLSLTLPSLLTLPLKLLLTYTLYTLTKWLYRLTLHPLSRFPGPKTAAMTRLYAMSYDFPHYTSYIKHFVPWHDTYDSPIIRIEPNHLHIRDIDAYNEIYRVGTKMAKDPVVYNFPATEGSLFNELDPKAGVGHRGLYNSWFSKGGVEGREWVIWEDLARFLGKVEGLARKGEKGESVDLSLGFRCLLADSLIRFTQGVRFGALDADGFGDETLESLMVMAEQGGATMAWYASEFFVVMFRVMMWVPRERLPLEPLRRALKILDDTHARITELSKMPKDEMPPTAFQTALDPDLKKGRPRLTVSELAADGLMFFFAGTDTTSNALTFAIYYLAINPNKLAVLTAELKTAIPELTDLTTDPAETSFPAPWPVLEKLPYLRGVIKESLRLSHGVPGKIPRFVPPGGMTLCGQFIPAGTAISSCAYAYFMNPKCYVDPEAFKPERWIEGAEDGSWSANNGVDPERYFVPFSRGSRSCLGMYFAWAQLYCTVAYLVRNFEVKLDLGPGGMKEGDMRWHDSFIISTFGRLKVRVKRVES